MRLPRRWRSNRVTWACKRFLKRLVGREVWARRTVRLPMLNKGGWAFSAAHLPPSAIIYSIGVGDDIDFDRYLIANHDVYVHAFDPTPHAVQWVQSQNMPERFVFHQWAVAAECGELSMCPTKEVKPGTTPVMWTASYTVEVDRETINVPAMTLKTIMSRLEHVRIDLLKMDIEGLEYEVIESLAALTYKPTQLLVEFHHRFAHIGIETTRRALETLGNMGYELSAVSRTGREISFILASALRRSTH